MPSTTTARHPRATQGVGPATYADGVARVEFTKNMRRHVDCPADVVPGATAGEALAAYFQRYPAVRSYVLDEQGAVRRHVAVFVDGAQLRDPVGLSDELGVEAEIYVMQALSGGA